MCVYVYAAVYVWMVGWLAVWRAGWMDGWTDVRMYVCMYVYKHTCACVYICIIPEGSAAELVIEVVLFEPQVTTGYEAMLKRQTPGKRPVWSRVLELGFRGL